MVVVVVVVVVVGGQCAWTERCLGTTWTEGMDRVRTAGSFTWRVVVGVIPFAAVFSARPLAVVLPISWRNCSPSLAFFPTILNLTLDAQLNFRGQRIWSAAMQHLLSIGMNNAQQALLSGCSAGGLASIIHCDEFGELFPHSTKVKCLSDAGFFLDATDVSGGHTLRNLFAGVVSLQLHASLAPSSADPHGSWKACKLNHAQCNSSQIQFLQDFRNQMLHAIKDFSASSQNGLFINSCFVHCQSETQDTWFADDSPVIGNKALSVGDWYFDRVGVKAIDCAYPCDTTCHNLVFK
ncbi:hypothetical protein TIFTF001_021321 [Ficus carica]|uniref:Pectin acetylesterase n=1 Tax=Ficus carica TaxID=3494 RepID=A0AA88AGH4_FICCA|nr:hypothetical protein TIFTF001_021321 [Ficus carica]